MWDYSDKVMDHYRNPRNVGKIDDADLIGEAGSLACGDSLKLYIKLKDGIITDAKFQTFGCAAAIATSSTAIDMIKGKTVEYALSLTNSDIVTELDGLPPQKIHCSVLAEEAIAKAVEDYRSKHQA